MKSRNFFIGTMMMGALMGCSSGPQQQEAVKPQEDTFKYLVEQFADLKIMRYQVPGFEKLSLNEKKLVYFLSQAALEGRDMIFDQNGKYNLAIRRTLEAIYTNYQGERSGADWDNLVVYLKRVWFANGIHHHYSTDKFKPGFSEEFFEKAALSIDASKLPLSKGENAQQLVQRLKPVIFDPTVDAKRVNQVDGADLVATSANNYYEGVTQAEVEAFYQKMKDPKDSTPISYGLNSKLVKTNGQIKEKVWKVGGMYGPAIEKIVFWLEKAVEVAENPKQKAVITNLVKYYKSGDLKDFDAYSIQWVGDLDSRVDFVNGFIENYGDPLGYKSSWESVVNFKNLKATHRTEIISSNAQWFEDHSPVDERFKKKKVKGVSAKVITATMLGGDCFPSTPIGVNLPNADWIRKDHGSKSVTIENITEAYDKASRGNGFLEEFAYDEAEIQRAKKYGFQTGNLHTDLHECLGHGSGQLLPGTSPDALKAYGSTIEEARADLFGLYYMMDPQTVKLGLLPNMEAPKAEYDGYIRNGLMTQLTRIEPGNDIEESHMRNRQLIAKWCYEMGRKDNVIEQKTRDGKTFFVINDYQKLRALFGQLLVEIQRIKSEGDFEGGRKLVENYAVKVNLDLHKEVLARFKKLNLAPYGGFMNPEYVLIKKDGQITDIKVQYPDDYAAQMLKYSKEHSWLPTNN